MNTAKESALKVWRYELPRKKNEAFWLNMPKDAEIFSVSRLNNEVFLWALVNPEMGQELRYFYVVPDNFPLPSPGGVENYTIERLRPVGTYMGFGQALHVFELVGCRPVREPGEGLPRLREPGEEG